MRDTIFGQQILTEDDLCNFYLSNPDEKIKRAIVEGNIKFVEELELSDVPKIQSWNNEPESFIEVSEWDSHYQQQWLMPDEYKEFDIAKFVLDQCDGYVELQRAGQELLIFQERGLFPLLRYLKYLVDTMRKNNIVWGVGRGSSIASFVLFLIGVHRINSLYYGLSIDEFLK
jgi:hypothetical protein